MLEHKIKNEVIYCEAEKTLKTIHLTLMANYGPGSKYVDDISILDNADISKMVFDILEQYHRLVESLKK